MSEVGLLSKLIKGTGLRGAVNYASQNGELAPLCGNMAGTTPRALAAEFSAARVLRPSCKKACWHFILSLPDHDLSEEDWDKAARTYLQEMGVDPDRHQWVAFKHSNTDHPHLHIIASRIAIRDGKLAREHRGDYRLSHKAAAAASRAVGLKPVAPVPAHQRRASLRRGEIAHAERVAGSPHKHPKLQIAARLDAALAHAGTLEQFQSVAADHGVDVKFSSNSGGIYGVSYRLADPAEREGFKVEWVKGSQVGKAYTITSITRRLAGDPDTPVSWGGPRVRQDILQKLAREQQSGKEILRWANGYVAAMATPNEIRWRTGSAAEAAVCAALAKEKGWSEMVLADRGSDEKNRAAVEAYHRAGISVQLNGQRYPAPTSSVTQQMKEPVNGPDERDPRAGTGGSRVASAELGVAEVDGKAGERSSPQDQRCDAEDRLSAPVLPGSAGAVGQAIADGERNRPDAQKAATGSTKEGEEQVDLLDFLNDPVGTRARAQRALEDLSEVNPGDHVARIVAEAHQPIVEAADPLDFLEEQSQPAPISKPEPKTVTAQEAAPISVPPTNEDFQRAEDEAVAQLAKYEGDMEGARPRTSTQIEVDLVAARHQREWHEMQSLIHRMKPGTMKEIASLREREGELGIALALARKREAEARRQIRRDPAAMAAIHSRATGLARERTERKKADELRRMAEKAKKELVRQQKEEETERRRKAEENQRPAKKVKKGQKNAA